MTTEPEFARAPEVTFTPVVWDKTKEKEYHADSGVRLCANVQYDEQTAPTLNAVLPLLGRRVRLCAKVFARRTNATKPKVDAIFDLGAGEVKELEHEGGYKSVVFLHESARQTPQEWLTPYLLHKFRARELELTLTDTGFLLPTIKRKPVTITLREASAT